MRQLLEFVQRAEIFYAVHLKRVSTFMFTWFSRIILCRLILGNFK